MVKPQSWFVLSNEVGTILAVYGSALRGMAVDTGRQLKRDCGARIALHNVTGNRPSIYGSISMTGKVEWL